MKWIYSRRHFQSAFITALITLAMIGFGYGGSDKAPTTSTGGGNRLAIVSGDQQVVEPGDTLASPLVVLLTDQEGLPVVRRIDFSIVEEEDE